MKLILENFLSIIKMILFRFVAQSLRKFDEEGRFNAIYKIYCSINEFEMDKLKAKRARVGIRF